MKTQATWTTKSGATVTATAELVTSKVLDADGDKIEVPCCEKRVSVHVEGHGNQGDWIRKIDPVNRDGTIFVARVGNLALTQDQVDTIRRLEAEIEATPEWQAHQATIAHNRHDLAKLDADRKAAGYCPKCASYCFGDCEANT